MIINQQVSGAFFNPTKGIYKITNTTTGRVYVGQSRRVQSRLSSHFGDLADGKHISKSMQADWTEYGPDSFAIEVSEYVDGQSNRLLREAEIIADAIAAGVEVYNTVITDPESIKNSAIIREQKRIERERVEADRNARLQRKKQARIKENAEKEARRAENSEKAARRKNDIYGRWYISGPESLPYLEGGQEGLRFPEADLRLSQEGIDRAAGTERPPAASVDENGRYREGDGNIQETLPDDDYYQENLTGEYLGVAGVTKEQWEDDIQLFKEAIEGDSIIDGTLAWFLRTYIRHDILFEAVENIDDPLIFIDFEKGPEYTAEIIREYMPDWKVVLKTLEESLR